MRTSIRMFVLSSVIAVGSLIGLTCAAASAANPVVAPAPAALRAATDLGPLNPSSSIQVMFALPLRDRAGLDRLIKLQHDRRSPLHHRWLTPQQFDTAFGADRASVAAVVAAVRAGGLRVDGINGPGTLIAVSGSVSAIEKMFNTRIDHVGLRGETHYANVLPAMRPAALGNVDLTVVGLDDLPRAVPLNHAPSTVSRGLAFAKARHDFGSGFEGSYVPAELDALYDMPIAFVTDGAGSTIATIAVNTFHQSDFDAFYTKWLKAWYASLGEPATGLRPTVVVAEGTPHYSYRCKNNPNCSRGVTSDVEQSQSYQPGATDIVYELGDLAASSILKGFNAMVTANLADDINVPFGGCENTSTDPAVDALIAQGSSQGQSFFAASGDNGARCFNGVGLAFGVDFPASDPNVTAVGGTTLTTDINGNYVNETAWSGSGGGVSNEWGIPSYQQGIPGEASTTFRNVPDVTMNADSISGDDVYFNGHDAIIGGTSLSSSAIMAGFNAIVAGGYGRQGGFNNEFYFIESTGSQGSIYDITTGSNGFYLAGPGYDNVTGWGSLDGTNLFFAWF